MNVTLFSKMCFESSSERNRARCGRAGRRDPAGDSAGGPGRAVQDEPSVHHSRRVFLPSPHTSPGLLQLQ
jgi:hypothetical protein